MTYLTKYIWVICPISLLASFAKWLIELKHEESYAMQVIQDSLLDFLNKHICKYDQHNEVPLNVLIDRVFESGYSRELCDSKGIQLGV